MERLKQLLATPLYLLVLAVWAFLYCCLAGVGKAIFWAPVVRWISLRFFAGTPENAADVLRNPIWLMCWFAIFSWGIIAYGLIMRTIFGGGGAIYKKSTSTATVSGMHGLEMVTIESKTKTGEKEFNPEAAHGKFTTAFWLALSSIAVIILAGTALTLPIRIGLCVALAVCLTMLVGTKSSGEESKIAGLFRKINVAAIATTCVHAAAWALIFLLCRVGVLSVSDSDYQYYLQQMPSVERVVADMKTADPFESTARQGSAFNRLIGIMEVMSDGRLPFRPLEQEIQVYGAYRAAAANAQFAGQALQKTGAAPGRNWFDAELVYDQDPGFQEGILTRYFSPGWRSRYSDALAKRPH
jgi:hypothetical protein